MVYQPSRPTAYKARSDRFVQAWDQTSFQHGCVIEARSRSRKENLNNDRQNQQQNYSVQFCDPVVTEMSTVVTQMSTVVTTRHDSYNQNHSRVLQMIRWISVSTWLHSCLTCAHVWGNNMQLINCFHNQIDDQCQLSSNHLVTIQQMIGCHWHQLSEQQYLGGAFNK